MAPYVVAVKFHLHFVTDISFLCLFTRTDGILGPMVIEAFDPSAVNICVEWNKAWSEDTRNFTCAPHTIGSKLRLKQKGQLTICETEVFGLYSK